MSSGAEHFIAVVDGMADDAILHVQSWGGMNTLGEALFYLQRMRVPYELNRFINKLRVYSISDQDNVGPWIRANFPTIPYIVSVNGFNQYGLAAWSGISGDKYYKFVHLNNFQGRSADLRPALTTVGPIIALSTSSTSLRISRSVRSALTIRTLRTLWRVIARLSCTP